MKNSNKTECYKTVSAEWTYNKLKGHLVPAWLEKARDTIPRSSASILKPDRIMCEATEQEASEDSRSTDHIVVNKSWFKSPEVRDTTVTNSDGGNTGVVESWSVSKRRQRLHRAFTNKQSLYVPGYTTRLVSVSIVINNGNNVVHEKKHCFFNRKANIKFQEQGREGFFLTHNSLVRSPLC